MDATNAGRRLVNRGFNQRIRRLRCPCSHSPNCTAAFGCLMRINEEMRRFKLASSWRVVRTFEYLCTEEFVCCPLYRRGRTVVRLTVPARPACVPHLSMCIARNFSRRSDMDARVYPCARRR